MGRIVNLLRRIRIRLLPALTEEQADLLKSIKHPCC